MIPKIIVLVLTLGTIIPGALEKGIQDTMNDPANIEEHQEYEEYANNKIHEDEVIEKFEYILDEYEFAIDVQEGEIEAYLEANDIPYESSKTKDGQFTMIFAEKYGILLKVYIDEADDFSFLSTWERCTHTYEPCLQLNINN